MPDLSAQEAADRLGVKLDTVYAYVSRGVLRARRQAGSRHSLFDADEVEAVARRGRPRRGSRPPALDLIVRTGLTHITDQRFAYRGRDVCAMARDRSFEQAAHWLWTGEEADDGDPWEPYPMTLPDLPHVRDRLRAAVILGSASEPLRSDLGLTAVVTAARSLIASMVSVVPAGRHHGQDRPAARASIAGGLWSRLHTGSAVSGPRASGMVTTLNAALVLLADHELAPSTLAARIAASVRADPFAVVLTGLGPVSGSLHGGASALAHQMLADAISRGPEPAVASALEAHGRLPGFGHPLYPDGDPRASLLLDMIKHASPGAPAVTAAGALTSAVRRHSRAEPNIDFGLAVLAAAAGMPATAGETIFTIARTAGWIAHAIEEYAQAPLRFRARAVAVAGQVPHSHSPPGKRALCRPGRLRLAGPRWRGAGPVIPWGTHVSPAAAVSRAPPGGGPPWSLASRLSTLHRFRALPHSHIGIKRAPECAESMQCGRQGLTRPVVPPSRACQPKDGGDSLTGRLAGGRLGDWWR